MSVSSNGCARACGTVLLGFSDAIEQLGSGRWQRDESSSAGRIAPADCRGRRSSTLGRSSGRSPHRGQTPRTFARPTARTGREACYVGLHPACESPAARPIQDGPARHTGDRIATRALRRQHRCCRRSARPVWPRGPLAPRLRFCAAGAQECPAAIAHRRRGWSPARVSRALSRAALSSLRRAGRCRSVGASRRPLARARSFLAAARFRRPRVASAFLPAARALCAAQCRPATKKNESGLLRKQARFTLTGRNTNAVGYTGGSYFRSDWKDRRIARRFRLAGI